MDVSAFQQLIARLTSEIAGMPPGAALESHPNAWHGAGSAHAPTVTRGRALVPLVPLVPLVLYLLPQGAIQFSPVAATA